MHFYLCNSALKHARRLVRGENIGDRSAVRYLAYGVVANAEIFNENFAVFVGGKDFGIPIRPGHTERKALNLSVRRCLDDFERSHLCRVDKAFARLVFHGDGLAVFGDFKIIGVFVEIETLRRFLLLYKISAVNKIGHFINAHACFGERTEQFIVGVKRLVPVAVTVNKKFCACQLVVGIILINLCDLHRTTD